MVLDHELHQRALAAVAAAGAAVDARKDAGEWIPTVTLPTVKFNASGWPTIVSETWSSEGGLPQPSRLFAEDAGRLTPLGWSNIAEFAAFVSHVLSRDDLRTRLAPPLTLTRSQAREDSDASQSRATHYVKFEAAFMVTGILDRARAIGVSSQEDLTEIYEQFERGWLATSLPVEYVVPLVLTAVDVDEPVTLSDTVRLIPLDEPTQQARGRHLDYATTVPKYVLAAATHALAISTDDLPNPGPGPRLFSNQVEAFPADLLESAIQALQLVATSHVGYATILRRHLGWLEHPTHDLPELVEVATQRRYHPSLDHGGWNRPPGSGLTKPQVEQAALALHGLATANRRVALAARRLTTASTRAHEEDQIVDACIGLEALLGDGKTELTHRMSLRAATALATCHQPAIDPALTYQLAKKVYEYRSLVVHGATAIKDKNRLIVMPSGSSMPAAHVAMYLLRSLLACAIKDAAAWDPTKLDDTLFARLRHDKPAD